MGEGLAKPPQIKPCWVAPPHLPQGGTMLIFLLPGQGHVMTDSGRVPLKQIYVFGGPGGGGGGGEIMSRTILNACLVIYKKLTP